MLKHCGVVSNTEAKDNAKFRSTQEWKLFRLSLINQRQGTCEMCGSSYAGKRTKMLQIHHLDSINYKDLTPSKFRLVCSSCHDLIERMKVKKSWGQYAELWHGLLDKFMGVV